MYVRLRCVRVVSVRVTESVNVSMYTYVYVYTVCVWVSVHESGSLYVCMCQNMLVRVC